MNLSVLFVTYNRSNLLKKAVGSLIPFLERTALKYEVVVADDYSAPEHKELMRALPVDRIVGGSANVGTGANTNRGLEECRAPFILQIQDDWEYLGTEAELIWAAALLENDPEIGVLQLAQTNSDLPASERSFRNNGYVVFRNDGLFWNRSCGVRPYGDIPHLKRRGFIDDIGPYLEGVPMGVGENDFKRRVATQRKWKVAQIGRLPLFRHLGEVASFNRASLSHPVVRVLRAIPLFGPGLERVLRRAITGLDHGCARMWSPVFEVLR